MSEMAVELTHTKHRLEVVPDTGSTKHSGLPQGGTGEHSGLSERVQLLEIQCEKMLEVNSHLVATQELMMAAEENKQVPQAEQRLAEAQRDQTNKQRTQLTEELGQLKLELAELGHLSPNPVKLLQLEERLWHTTTERDFLAQQNASTKVELEQVVQQLGRVLEDRNQAQGLGSPPSWRELEQPIARALAQHRTEFWRHFGMQTGGTKKALGVVEGVATELASLREILQAEQQGRRDLEVLACLMNVL